MVEPAPIGVNAPRLFTARRDATLACAHFSARRAAAENAAAATIPAPMSDVLGLPAWARSAACAGAPFVKQIAPGARFSSLGWYTPETTPAFQKGKADDEC